MQALFQLLFWASFVAMILAQGFFAIRASSRRKRAPSHSELVSREPKAITSLRAARSVFLVGFLIVYAFNPAWATPLSAPTPPWLRWAGFALVPLSLALYAWSRIALGRAWSSGLQTHGGQHLVTTGPYAHIRHPVYLALMGFLTGTAFLASNWLFFAIVLVSVIDLVLRIPREEKMMIETFGHLYKDYARKTGALLPR